VRDYDEAIAWFSRCLDFTLIEDSPRTPTKRWVLVSLMFFLHTDDFHRDHVRMSAAGVRFVEEPRHEEYGTVVVFEDLHGNRWDLIQRSTGAER
jgi:uncharacterized glyoxalase superfamily protein PhnB